jgi:hypothetical protein
VTQVNCDTLMSEVQEKGTLRQRDLDSVRAESIDIKRASVWMVLVLALAKVERAQAVLEAHRNTFVV